jgi:hypothetical protein
MSTCRARKGRRARVGLAAAAALATAAIVGAAAALFISAAPAASVPTFESHWQDGKAELDGYRFTVTRYGQPRHGTAVMVFVTEPFSEAKRVKVDDPKVNPKDTFEALKLNFVRDFQTGIYDYNTMASLFVRSRDFSPAKISFSSAEWCGHVYEEMTFGPRDIADRYSSYFEGESGDRRLNLTKDGIAEEELFIRLRGLRGEWLRPGERRTVPFLASAFYRRLAHRPLRWTTAAIERSERNEAVSVPAGRFDASMYTVTTGDGRAGRFWIEAVYPHRILRWDWKATAQKTGRGWSPSEGLDEGELTGTARLPYWRLHNLGDEKYLREWGLTAGAGGATVPSGKGKPGERK